MLYLLLSILSSTAILVIFKILERKSLKAFHAIVVNYFIATVLGFLLTSGQNSIFTVSLHSWHLMAIFIGLLFIIMFNLIALSTQKSGIAITTIASRMSVIIPIIFSIIYYRESSDNVKIIGIISGLAAILLTSIPSRRDRQERNLIYLPLLIFFGAGFIDSTIKYCQGRWIDDLLLPSFTSLLFAVAGISGLILAILRNEFVTIISQPKVLFWGSLLGLANFGSFYFFVSALNKTGLDSSKLFGINHLGIVTASILLALIFFREKLSGMNWIGIIMAFTAIVLLSAF